MRRAKKKVGKNYKNAERSQNFEMWVQWKKIINQTSHHTKSKVFFFSLFFCTLLPSLVCSLWERAVHASYLVEMTAGSLAHRRDRSWTLPRQRRAKSRRVPAWPCCRRKRTGRASETLATSCVHSPRPAACDWTNRGGGALLVTAKTTTTIASLPSFPCHWGSWDLGGFWLKLGTRFQIISLSLCFQLGTALKREKLFWINKGAAARQDV